MQNPYTLSIRNPTKSIQNVKNIQKPNKTMENLSDTYHDPSHRFQEFTIGMLTPQKKGKFSKIKGWVYY